MHNNSYRTRSLKTGYLQESPQLENRLPNLLLRKNLSDFSFALLHDPTLLDPDKCAQQDQHCESAQKQIQSATMPD